MHRQGYAHDYSYTYDAYGNLTSRAEAPAQGSNTLTATMTQEGLVTEAADQYVKTVDFSAQLQTDTSNGVTNNRLSSVSRGGGTTGIASTNSNYVYDASGNLLEDANHVYEYDALGEQTKVYNRDTSQPGDKGVIVAQYFYGASGERIGKEDYDASGNAKSYTQYQRDGSAVIMEETWRTSDMKETAQKTYVYAGGRMAVTQDKTWDYPPPNSTAMTLIITNTSYYATDHLGTVRFVYTLDSSGNLVSSSTHDYSPFGVEIGPVETSDNTHKYTGQERDPETGNDYMHYRFYGDSIGRFMKPDDGSDQEEDAPQSWNLYSYVQGNPINTSDPTGRYGRGSGFTDRQWKRFNWAQKHAAKQMEREAKRLRKKADKLEKKGDRKDKRKAALLRKAAGHLAKGAAALRSDGSDGKIVNALHAAAYAKLPNATTNGAADTPPPGNVVYLNIDRPIWNYSGWSRWMIGHESLHTGGITYDKTGSNGATAYKFGNRAQREAFRELRGTAKGYDNPDNLMELVYPSFNGGN